MTTTKKSTSADNSLLPDHSAFLKGGGRHSTVLLPVPVFAQCLLPRALLAINQAYAEDVCGVHLVAGKEKLEVLGGIGRLRPSPGKWP